MGSRLLANPRSGNLAENLGTLLLKGVAAVADVPRTEDVGIDAVATLLRLENKIWYPEDAFVVQFKAESVKEINYDEHATKWFSEQSQPMFIGRVSLENAAIALYSPLYANHGILSMNAKTFTLKFGQSTIPSLIEGRRYSAWAGGDGDDHSVTIWAGEPVLTWHLSDIKNATWLESAYSILKRFLSLARRELEFVSFGQCSDLQWMPNDLESIKMRGLLMMKGHPSHLRDAAERSIPALRSIMLSASTGQSQSSSAIMASIIDLTAALREAGIDIDPDNLFQMQRAIRQSPAPSAPQH